jgi:polyhydroxyalkanoate synthesis regulator phasin
LCFSDFIFVEQQIAKTVKDLIENTTHLVKDLKPETKVKAEAAVVEEIKKASKNGIAELNQKIERDLKIPENVLLITDTLQSSSCTQDDVNNLSEDCQRLEVAVVQVRQV